MKMNMDPQEVNELGCREEVVQGTDTRGSVLFKALSRDGGSAKNESRLKPSGHHNSAATHGFIRTSLHHHDVARLADEPMLHSPNYCSDQVSTTAPSGAAIAGRRRTDAVGGRRPSRPADWSSATNTSSASSLLPNAGSGNYQKRRSDQVSRTSRVKYPSNGNNSGRYSVVTTAAADSSSSLLRGGSRILTHPPTSKGNFLASLSRSRHRPKATGPEVVLDDGSTWSVHGKVRGAPSMSGNVSSSLDSSSDEECRPVELQRQQPALQPGVIFKSSRDQFDQQQSRVLVINGVGDEPKGYVLADSPPHLSSYPMISSSVSIQPIYNNSRDSVEMRLEECAPSSDGSGHPAAVRLLDCPEVQSPRRLQRSVSDESSYGGSNSSGSSTSWHDSPTQEHSYRPQSCIEEEAPVYLSQTRVEEVPAGYLSQTRLEEVPAMHPQKIRVEGVSCMVDNKPLDLSMGRRVTSAGGYIEHDEGYVGAVELVVNESATPCLPPTDSEPPSLLMQLADACTFVLEEETRTSKSCESSPPPSSLSDSNSCHSVYQEKLELPSESTYYTTSQEYFTESQENSLDNSVSFQVEELSDMKYEVSNDFSSGGIILNSNVLGDRVFHDTTAFGLQQIDVCSAEDDKGMLREVANLTVEDGYTDGVYRNVYASEGNSTPSMDDYHYFRGGQDSSSGSECSSFTGRSSSSSHHANGGMATSVICTSGGGDNKKRLRLGKAEYESMSEQDRKIRHRVLDNQRSKQYRERRRRMITKLQCDITNEENTNKALKDKFEYYERRLILVKEAMQRLNGFNNSSVLVPTPHFVKAEC